MVNVNSAVPPSPHRFDDAFLRQLEALTILAKRTRGGDGRGERRSRRLGAGIEFADHREYAPGDDVRTLDWNLFARLDRPYVRLREEDEDLTVTVIVDTSASMGSGTPPKLELALRIAAALAYVGLTALDRVGVALVTANMDQALAPMRGKAAVTRILDLLGNARAAGGTNLAAAAREVHARSGPIRRGLAVVISDLLDVAGCQPLLNALRAAHQQVVVVQVTASADVAVPEDDGDLLVRDVETGEERELTITPAVRLAQVEQYEALLRGLAGICRTRGIPCFQIPSHTPFQDAVLRILRAGGVLG